MYFFILILSLLCFKIQFSEQQSCQYTPGVEYIGLNLPNTPILSRSASECCQYCLSNTRCVAWNFIYDRFCPKCYLKYALGNNFRFNFNSYYSVKPTTPITTTIAPITTTAPVTTTAPITTTAPVTTTIPVVTPPPGQPFCSVGDNTVYSETVAIPIAVKDYPPGTDPAAAIIDCCSICAAFPICSGFNFNKATGSCTLLDGLTSATNPPAQANTGFISGFLVQRN